MLCFGKVPLVKKFMDKRGGGGGSMKISSRNFFCLTVPKIFVGEPFSVSLISGIEKVWIRGGGRSQDSPSKIFCLRVLKNFVQEPLCAVFQKVSKREKIYGSEAGRRVSSFSLEKFLSHSAEKLRTRTLQCFTNFEYRKIFRFGGLCHVFCRIFSSQSAENFRRGTFCAVFRKASGGEKVWIRGGGEDQAFPSKIFCVTVPKNFVGEPFCAAFQKTSASENVYG